MCVLWCAFFPWYVNYRTLRPGADLSIILGTAEIGDRRPCPFIMSSPHSISRYQTQSKPVEILVALFIIVPRIPYLDIPRKKPSHASRIYSRFEPEPELNLILIPDAKTVFHSHSHSLILPCVRLLVVWTYYSPGILSYISQGAISERSDRPALRPKGCNKWLHTLTSPTPCFNEYCLPFSTSRLECLADNIMNCSTDVPSMNIGRDLIDLSKGTDVLRTGLVRIRGLGRISKRLWKMRRLTLVENALLIQHVSRISTPLGFVF